MYWRFNELIEEYLPKDVSMIGNPDSASRLVNHMMVVHGLHMPSYTEKNCLIVINLEKADITEENIEKFRTSIPAVKCAGILIMSDWHDKSFYRELKEIGNGLPFTMYYISIIPWQRKKTIDKLLFAVQLAWNKQLLLQGFMTSLLYHSDRIRDEVYLLHIMNMDVFQKYRAALIFAETRQDLDMVYEQAQVFLYKNYYEMLSLRWRNVLICVLLDNNGDGVTAEEKLEKTFVHIQRKLGVDLEIALGNPYLLEEIRESLGEAERVLDVTHLLTRDETHPHVYTYSMLGLYRVLYELPDEVAVRGFVDDVFRPLQQLDEEKGTNFFETLACYFSNNHDLKKTASDLYLHVNTLRYRLKKIEEVMKRDLDDVNDIAEIALAFNTRRFLNVIPKQELSP